MQPLHLGSQGIDLPQSVIKLALGIRECCFKLGNPGFDACPVSALILALAGSVVARGLAREFVHTGAVPFRRHSSCSVEENRGSFALGSISSFWNRCEGGRHVVLWEERECGHKGENIR
jgi:hypothetical protein